MSFRAYKGFTLIELMVTIAIIGIALSIAVPSFNSWLQRERVRGAASEVEAWVKYARSETTRQNIKVYLQVTTGSNWRILASNISGTCTALATCDLKSLTQTRHPRLQLVSASTALNDTEINPIDGLLTFSAGSTSPQSLTLESGDFQLSVLISRTGITSLCVPAGKPQLGGYSTCS